MLLLQLQSVQFDRSWCFCLGIYQETPFPSSSSRRLGAVHMVCIKDGRVRAKFRTHFMREGLWNKCATMNRVGTYRKNKYPICLVKTIL